ncbi:MAG: hypothetical protein ACKO3V_04185 [Pirellula sp.]
MSCNEQPPCQDLPMGQGNRSRIPLPLARAGPGVPADREAHPQQRSATQHHLLSVAAAQSHAVRRGGPRDPLAGGGFCPPLWDWAADGVRGTAARMERICVHVLLVQLTVPELVSEGEVDALYWTRLGLGR